MAEKETKMKLKVDLQCGKCYKKVKKVLSKFPQIRDQAFDKKENIVTITAVCCNPEKIRDKLCYKGRGSIKSIEIVETPKPKPPEKKKESDKPKPIDEPKKKKEEGKPEPKKGDEEKPTPVEQTKDPTPNPACPPIPVPVPPPMAVPFGICFVPCYVCRPGGPCVCGYSRPPPCYDGYCGRPICDSHGGGMPYCVSRCDQYFSEEDASGCKMM